MNIFVAKLKFSTSESSLRQLFEQFGEVDSAKIIMDRTTGRSKGFGFVEMSDDESANQAISSLNETDFEGSNIVVKQARERESNGGGDFRGRKQYNR